MHRYAVYFFVFFLVSCVAKQSILPKEGKRRDIGVQEALYGINLKSLFLDSSHKETFILSKEAIKCFAKKDSLFLLYDLSKIDSLISCFECRIPADSVWIPCDPRSLGR